MVELSFLASAAIPPGIPHQEHQSLCRNPKEFQNLLPVHGRKQDASRSASVHFPAQHLEDLGRPMRLLSHNGQSAWLPPMIEKTVLIDMQGSQPNSVIFSLGIAEKCIRNEKIMKLLMSGAKLTDGQELAISLLSEIMGFHDVTIDMLPSTHELKDDNFPVYEADIKDSQHPLDLQTHIYAPEPQLDFVRDLSSNSYFTVHPDGRLLFADSAAQMEDLLSVVAEFNLPKRSVIGSKQSLLVPYFTRKSRGQSQAHKQVSSPAVAPLKSPDNAKLKTLQKKKKNKKFGRERDLYQRNNFHACESLLSVVLDKSGSSTIPSLKKSGFEITQLLNQLSAGIAGTGLAVIFSVLYKMACGRAAALCATRLWNTGFGLGLFWLSSGIIGLRDTITYVSKNSGKLNLREEEITGKIKQSMNEVLVRAAALLAVVMLRFA